MASDTPPWIGLATIRWAISGFEPRKEKRRTPTKAAQQRAAKSPLFPPIPEVKRKPTPDKNPGRRRVKKTWIPRALASIFKGIVSPVGLAAS